MRVHNIYVDDEQNEDDVVKKCISSPEESTGGGLGDTDKIDEDDVVDDYNALAVNL